jgi:hypothetical protein
MGPISIRQIILVHTSRPSGYQARELGNPEAIRHCFSLSHSLVPLVHDSGPIAVTGHTSNPMRAV